jgi:NADPH:quinone reductase-like Zn-dependent oxidoreductase
MKAVGLYRYLPIDDPESFLDLELDTPSTSGRDLLVEVKAISVNPVDTKRRAPKDLVEKTPRVLGWDVAGVVKSVGPEVSLFKPGDAVYYAGSIGRPATANFIWSTSASSAGNRRTSDSPRPRRCRSPRLPPGKGCSTAWGSPGPARMQARRF